MARTLVDLCEVVPNRLVERALDQAYVLRLLKPGAFEDPSRAPTAAEPHAFGLLATERRAAALTRSELEERFLKLVRKAGLHEPEVNATVAGYEVDFLWRERARVVELDGYAYHSVPGAFERDRRRDVDLELAGYRVTRFTYRQVVFAADETLRATRRLLRQ